MHEEVGKYLKEAREGKGITLDEVAEETRIQKRYLEELENDNFSELPGEAYVKGFLKNYAAYVGISEKEIIRRYNSLKHEEIPIPVTVLEEEQKKEHVLGERRKVKKINVFLLFFVLAVFIIGMTIIFVKGPEKAVVDEIETAQKNAEKTELAENEKVVQETIKEDKVTSQTTAAVTGAKKEENNKNIENKKKKLVLKLSGASWIEIKDGDRIVKSGLYTSGEAIEAESSGKLSIHVGNAAAVNVDYNGENIGVLGKEGSVVRKSFE